MIVVDSSAVLSVLLRISSAELRDRVLSESLHAPHLIDLEVMQVIRRWVFSRELPLDRAEQALEDFRELRIKRYGHQILLDRIWQLRENLTAYDAAYVALAEILATVVITTDGRLARAPGISRYIHVVT